MVLTSASIITAALPLAYDTFVFGIIMLKTYRHAVEMRKHGQTSITEVLLRDGKSRPITVPGYIINGSGSGALYFS